MIYLSDYERVFHQLHKSSRYTHRDLRTVATALRGRIDEHSRTKSEILVPLALSLFPVWKNCYRESTSILSRRIRYRLAEENTRIYGIDIDDLISTSFMAMLDTCERFLEGTNPQALHVFIVNTLPMVYCQHIRLIGERYSGVCSGLYLILNEPKDDVQGFDSEYREDHLLGMSKSTFYRILQSSDFQGSTR